MKRGSSTFGRGGSRAVGAGERQVRRLLARMRKEGDRGLVHKLRGRKSKRRIAEGVERRAKEVVAREYKDFGPTRAAEYLATQHGLAVSRETLRKWMMQAGLWKRRKQRVLEVTCLAAAAELCRGVGAVGHLGTRLVRRAGGRGSVW